MTELTAADLERCAHVRAMCACDQLRRASRVITQLYDAAVAPSGLKVTQMPILVALGSAGDLPLTTLAAALSLDRTTLTRNVNVLEQRGFVGTAAHEDDARVRMVSLTDEGARALSGALERWEQVQQTVQDQFGGPRLRALYDELATLTTAAGA